MKKASIACGAIVCLLLGLFTVPTYSQILLKGVGTATVDGVMESGEWDGAGKIDYLAYLPVNDGGGTIPATLLVMNDGINLFVALVIKGGPLRTTSLGFDFDNDHNGIFPEEGDDGFGMNAGLSLSPQLFDYFFTMQPPCPSGVCGLLDIDFGGTNDGLAAYSNDGVSTFIEISHPLNSNDNLHDFSLSPGDTVGFRHHLTLWTDKAGCGNGPACYADTEMLGSYKDIVILSPRLVASPTTGLFTPATTDFSNINIGSVSGSRIFTIDNTGSSDLMIDSAKISGFDASMFVLSLEGPNPCPNVTPVVPPEDSCTLGVTFAPTLIGAKTGKLRIVSNASNSPVLDIPLTGIGVSEPVFDDVQEESFAEDFINTLNYHAITAGCGNNNYCPEGVVTRAQMAVFMETSLGRTPATSCTGTFLDVNASTVGDLVCRYIEDFAAAGITGGCEDGKFCPNDPVTRAQMAVFIEAALGAAPATTCTGTFSDVGAQAPGDLFCKYIEDFATRGITGGCGGGRYCPNDPVTRAQMAVFLVAAPDPLLP